jgi:phosphate-selective porin
VTFRDWIDFHKYREARDCFWDFGEGSPERHTPAGVIYLSGVYERHDVFGTPARMYPRTTYRTVEYVLHSDASLTPYEIAAELRADSARWQRWCVEAALRGRV